MRLILDTVVIIRALLDLESRSGRILFKYSRAYDWIVSEAIIAEYLEVTSRPVIIRKLANRNRSTTEFLDLLESATVVSPAVILAVCRDPGDDKFLAAALEGKADYIVSEDLDLLSLSEYEGTMICNSQTMIDLLSDADVS